MASHAPIAASEVRFRSLFEHTPELILYQDREGTILDANPTFLALVQLSKEQVLGRPYNEFLPPTVRPLFTQKLHEARLGHTVRFDVYTAQGNSEPRYWDIVKIPLVEQDQVVGVHMVARDITEKAQHQEEIFAQNQDLQQFTYMVSHNLRAPLANALGLVDLLSMEQPGSAAYEQTHSHLQANLLQLDLVLQDMNTILSIRDRQGITLPATVHLARLVQQVVQSLTDTLTQAGGTIQVAIADELVVQAHHAYLHSIFFNLLSNAIKYRAAPRPLRVTISATGGEGTEKQVVVADNGSGFDRERAGSQVFQLYKRFHANPVGRGLGLYLVKTQLGSMGGRIEVTSQVDAGTRFTLVLP